MLIMLNQVKFDSHSIHVIIDDIFGSITVGIHELGLFDATDQEDFFQS